jgi:membrane protease YdiL (CAAX protease family)
MDSFPAITDHLLVWVFGFAIPFISGVRGRQTMEKVEFTPAIRRRFYIANSISLALMSCLVLITWLAYKRPFSELGFRPVSAESRSLYWWLTGILVALYLADTIYAVKKAKEEPGEQETWESSVPFLPKSVAELPAYTLMCVSAGVCEEIMFRGFMVTYFLVDFKYPPSFPILAAFIPAALFSLAHYYQGGIAVLKILLLSIFMGLIFILSGSLWIVIIVHFGIDLLGGILSMILQKKYNR